MTVVINGTTGVTAPGTQAFGSGTALGGATNPIVSMAQGANQYVQSYIINNTNGTSSSADFVAYPSNGTDAHGWVDMGITSLAYADTTYTVTGPNESYLFASAPSGSSTTGNLVIATDNTGTANSIQFYTNGFTQAKSAVKMTIFSSGGVSIGTTADPGAGAIYATGNITAYYSSDIKFKENVRAIPNAVETVNAIGGKLFDWTDDYIKDHGGADGYFVQKQDFGVVAQDVQKVFPVAVRTRPDGSLAVDYEKLSALAFAALVELTKRIEVLEAK